MKRFSCCFLSFLFVFTQLTLTSFANYDDEYRVHESAGGGGSGMATEAAAGVLTYLVKRAVQKKGGAEDGASTAGQAPPTVVTVVEFPVTPDIAEGAQAEITVQKGDSVVTVNTPVNITKAPGQDESNKCCKLTSLVLANKWQHAIKVSVSGGGGEQLIQPGQQAVFSGKLGECPKINIKSAEHLGEDDAHLVAENVSLCCKDLKAGRYKSFFAVDVARYTFVELDKDCGGTETPPPPVAPEKPEEPKTPSKPEEPPVTENPPPHAPPEEPKTPTTPENPIPKTPPENPPTHTPPPEIPKTPTEKSDCACCCHLVHTWSKETPIEYKFGSPADGSASVPLGKEFPLVVSAVDMDALNVSCEQKGVECGGCPPCAGGGGGGPITDGPVSGGGGGGTTSAAGNAVMIATGGGGVCKKPCEGCTSLKRLPLAAPLHFRWEIISGPGALKTNPPYPHGLSAAVEGPAAVYVAPDTLHAGVSRTVTIRVTIDDNPYLADLDDDAVVQTITLNLVGRKEQAAVNMLSPTLGYGSIPNKPSECPCQPVTNWTAGTGIAPDGAAGGSYNVCVDSYSVLSAPAKDTDTIQMQCAGKKCSSPPVVYNVHDALLYNWKPSAGKTAGALESAVYQAPSTPGNVTVVPTASDSTIQYPDSALTLPAFNLKVGTISIESVTPAAGDKLLLGDDLKIKYKIAPDDFGFEKLELRVYNKNGDLIYRREDLDKSGGTHETTWPKAKWNQEPHIGAFANPNNGPYEIQISGVSPNCASAVKTIDTKLTISAEIRDLKAGTASRASGLDTAIHMLKIILRGPGGDKTFQSPDVTTANIPGLPAGSYGKTISLDKDDLNRLADGKWTLQVKDPYDGAGNLTDADPSTMTSDPYESEIELW